MFNYQTDIRDFPADEYPDIDWIVADLSFIRIATVAQALSRAAREGGHLLIMVKPQFELPSALVPSGGVVSSPEHREQAVRQAVADLEATGLQFEKSADSGVRGKTGNQETFILLSKPPR